MTFMCCGHITYLFILLGMIMNLTNKLRNKVTMHDQHFMLNDHVNNHKRAQQYFVLLVVMINLIIHDRSITFALLPMRHMQCVTSFVCSPAVADNKLLKHIVVLHLCHIGRVEGGVNCSNPQDQLLRGGGGSKLDRNQIVRLSPLLPLAVDDVLH